MIDLNLIPRFWLHTQNLNLLTGNDEYLSFQPLNRSTWGFSAFHIHFRYWGFFVLNFYMLLLAIFIFCFVFYISMYFVVFTLATPSIFAHLRSS